MIKKIILEIKPNINQAFGALAYFRILPILVIK